MDKDLFLFLAAKIFASEASPEEKQQVETAMQQDVVLQALYTTYQQHWNSNETISHLSIEQALHSTWDKIRMPPTEGVLTPVVPMDIPQTKKIFNWRWGVAAAAVFCMVLTAWWFNDNNSEIKYLEASNKVGVRSNLVLSDGTKVWLAADSKLRYPAVFKGDKREIELNGEAFFEVKRDTLHPFVVHTLKGDVKVLGTSFNVSAYESDSEVVTAVATGKVAYLPPGNNDAVTLLPGNRARFNAVTNSTVVETIKEEADWAWTSGKIVFQSDSLGRIATTLYRYFGKPVVFNDNQYQSYRYTGSFNNLSPEEILEMLEKTRRFPFKASAQSITIGK